MPSANVVDATGVGDETLRVGETGGVELTFTVIWNVEVSPVISVKVNEAAPELLKVTGKGVLRFEDEIVAPVKDQLTVAVVLRFVAFWSPSTNKTDEPWQTEIELFVLL